IAARTSSSIRSGSIATLFSRSSSRAIERRWSMAPRASTIWSTRSGLKEVKDMGASPSGGGLFFRGSEPGIDHKLLAVEIEIGGPAAILPAARHEEEAAQGEIGEGVFACREEAAEAGGQGHEALLFLVVVRSHVLAVA